jgi:ATP-dependent RNA helicase DeaD
MSEQNIFSTLSSALQNRLSSLFITELTPVQLRIIPEIRSGKNVLFQSETGTGKTFAYLLPLIEKLESSLNPEKLPRLCICTPTVELASQIRTAAQTVTSLKCALFIGGVQIKRQIEELKEKPDIVVGTPARLLELIQLRKLKTAAVSATVFDEADRLVKQELREETTGLLKALPGKIQIIACSATMNGATKNFFGSTEIIVLPPEDVLRHNITHYALYAEQRDKIETLRKFLSAVNPEKALVFTSRTDQVENIASKLAFKKVNCDALYAKQDKLNRKAALDRFRSGKCPVLITSDLAARGLDIPGITYIIQMDIPSDDDFFIHRAGRTARAGKTGINVVIGDEYEMQRYAALEKKLHIIVTPRVLYCGKFVSPEEADGQ